MNRENVTKWIEALRSGKYVQGRGKLEHQGRHCCMGVAAKVADIDIPVVKIESELAPQYRKIAEWLGYEVGAATAETYDNAAFRATVLMQRWNDVDGLTFNQIADKVELELNVAP